MTVVTQSTHPLCFDSTGDLRGNHRLHRASARFRLYAARPPRGEGTLGFGSFDGGVLGDFLFDPIVLHKLLGRVLPRRLDRRQQQQGRFEERTENETDGGLQGQDDATAIGKGGVRVEILHREEQGNIQQDNVLNEVGA